MKEHVIIANTTLSYIIKNLSNEAFSLEVDDINQVYIKNENYPEIRIKIIETELSNELLTSILKTFNKNKIESTCYDYIVFTTNSVSDTIYNGNLLELILSNVEDNIYDLNNPTWTLCESVEDDWKPLIEEAVNDMDLPTDKLSREELNVISK